jgi:hypothetical protein
MVTVITFLLSSGRGSVEANISKSGGSASELNEACSGM